MEMRHVCGDIDNGLDRAPLPGSAMTRLLWGLKAASNGQEQERVRGAVQNRSWDKAVLERIAK